MGFVHKKFGIVEKIKFIFWMTVCLVLGLGTVSEDFEVIIWATTDKPSLLFAILSTGILLPLQTCLAFPLMGHLVLADKQILEDKELPAPRRKIHFMFFSILSVGSYCYWLYLCSLFNRIIFFSIILKNL